MTVQIKNVALAGATGSLGTFMLQALLDASFKVTVLTRVSSSARFPESVKVAKVDYDSVESIKAALQGLDALVSTLGSQAAEQQKCLVEAAIAAGVRRIIPSEFGSDTESQMNRYMPVYKHKVTLQDYIKHETQGTESTYTFVLNNAFLDWGIENNFLFDLKSKKAVLYDGGDNFITVTPLDLVAKGTANILKHPDATANRFVRIHGARVSMKQLLDLVQKNTTDQGWTISEVDSNAQLQTACQNLKTDPSNAMAWILPMLHVAATGKNRSNDFSDNNDNALLGIKALTESEVEDLVKKSVQKAVQKD